MSQIFILLINFYQKYLSFDTGLFSLVIPGKVCKHSLRCSEYTKVMIKEKGVVEGLLLGFRRILSCR